MLASSLNVMMTTDKLTGVSEVMAFVRIGNTKITGLAYSSLSCSVMHPEIRQFQPTLLIDFDVLCRRGFDG